MKYKSVFTNSQAEVFQGYTAPLDTTTGYTLPLFLGDVVIETDGFELLSIEHPQQYNPALLTCFDYDLQDISHDKTQQLLVLKNYTLDIFIPIFLEHKSSGQIKQVDLILTLQNMEQIQKRTCRVLNQTSTQDDLEIALQEIQSQLSQHYIMKTCSNCKKSSWNPYGGHEFMDHLCFVKDEKVIEKLQTLDKIGIIEVMKYDEQKNFEQVLLTHTCQGFEPR